MLARKTITIESPKNLYRWARFWNSRQRRYFEEDIQIRREKQIQDFIMLNGFQRVHFIIDTDVFVDHFRVDDINDADLTVITDQKFSRYPCPIIIENIREKLTQCPNLYLCLNRTYINIDNTYCDPSLSDNRSLAVTQWLKKSLPELDIVDLSLDYLETGKWFTWVIPDRHYFIRHA